MIDCRLDRVPPVLPLDGCDILQKDGIEMARRHAFCDFRAFDDQDVQAITVGFGDLEGAIVVGGEIFLVRLILNMVRDSDGIQPLPPGLLRSNIRPNRPVREHRVDVKVALEGFVSWNVGNPNRFPVPVRSPDNACQRDE